MLHDFALQVTKQNGELYLTTSIQNMLHSLDRIIRYHQEKRILRISVLETPFDIFKDVRYWKVKFAGNEAVNRSFKKGLGTKVDTTDLLTWEEVKIVLASSAASLLSPKGINTGMHWYLCKNFFVSGQEEARSTSIVQFELLKEHGVDVLRYKPINSAFINVLPTFYGGRWSARIWTLFVLFGRFWSIVHL